jgi:L-ribulose-5-phosphate 3-epimerase
MRLTETLREHIDTMEIGVINSLESGGRCFDHVQRFGLKVCQLCAWDQAQFTPEIAQTVVSESARTGVRVCALWAGYPGPGAWNFTEGPITLGLVPPEYRAMRIDALKRAADFAKSIGAPAIITHAGFIPENVTDPEYGGTVVALRQIAQHCKSLGIGFWFETGQETPIVLLRTFHDIGTDNLGINLDPGNLILYGKGSPVDSLDVFGSYVRNLHIKDGLYPTNGRELGHEVPAGEGKVNFPALFKGLKELGFDGELIIEREISGEEQARDIRKTVDRLRQWLAEL